MDFSVAYSAQTEGSNPGARSICLAQGHRGKKVADSTGFEPGTSRSESRHANYSAARAPLSRCLFLQYRLIDIPSAAKE